MNIENNNTEMSNHSITPFSIEKGDIILLFIPAGKDIRVCENVELGLKTKQKPYWVEFNLDVTYSKAIKEINDNIAYLSSFLSLQNELVKKDTLKGFSSIEFRMINMFVKRKAEKFSFFEINTAGLSISSIRRLFHFLISEVKDSDNEAKYIIVEPSINVATNNPIFVTESNVTEILNTIYY